MDDSRHPVTHDSDESLPDGVVRDVAREFRATYHLMFELVGARLQHLKLSASQISLLGLVARCDSCRLGRLVEESRYCTKQNVSSLMSKLVKDGYVQSRTDPSDSRAKLFSLTGKGQRVLAEFQPLHREVLQEIFSCLDEEQLRTFSELLMRIRQRTQEMRSKGDD
ncbi:MAG: MarR family winged helix-turn-helix transcriptional regulator [Planctomycetota bacterium]|nr:MarR family winged helix-turn-helix transcriptional regulator [Planctomycetota bacterium]